MPFLKNSDILHGIQALFTWLKTRSKIIETHLLFAHLLSYRGETHEEEVESICVNQMNVANLAATIYP